MMRDGFFERLFRFSEGGVACGGSGTTVGGVALLERGSEDGAKTKWRVRDFDSLGRDLSACYGLPVEVVGKRDGLAALARALERGEIALAQIAALLLKFPDPPRLAKTTWSANDITQLAWELWASGLLKADWDESQHPRTGVPPNPGQFAPKPPELKPPKLPKPSLGWPSREVNLAARKWVTDVTEHVLIAGGRVLLGAIPIADAIVGFLNSISDTNMYEVRLDAQLKANFDPPKTLEELQIPPTENQLGYEQHHLVEQNPDNLEKNALISEPAFEKFGEAAIQDPSNTVWVPRLKHEEITADYNSRDKDDPLGRLRRDVVNEMDFNAQRAAAMAKLREYGILQ